MGEAIELSRDRRLWTSYCDSMDTLATLQLEQNRIDDAKATILSAEQRLSGDVAPLTHASIKHVRFRIALSENDVAAIRAFPLSEVRHLTHPVLRYRNQAIAVEVFKAVVTGNQPCAEHVRSLNEPTPEVRAAGRIDFAMVSLIAALRASGQEEEALSTYEGYKRVRRERYPIPEGLQKYCRFR